MTKSNLELRVLDRIRLLNGTKISGGELGNIFGYSGEDVRVAIKSLRLQGHPIAGTDADKGYWWARTPQELQGTIDKMDSLIQSHAAVKSGLTEAQRRLCSVRPGELFG